MLHSHCHRCHRRGGCGGGSWLFAGIAVTSVYLAGVRGMVLPPINIRLRLRPWFRRWLPSLKLNVQRDVEPVQFKKARWRQEDDGQRCKDRCSLLVAAGYFVLETGKAEYVVTVSNLKFERDRGRTKASGHHGDLGISARFKVGHERELISVNKADEAGLIHGAGAHCDLIKLFTPTGGVTGI